MTYPPRSEYTATVYALLAAHQVSDQLSYDGDKTIIATSLRVCCSHDTTEITFPDPYDNRTATISVHSMQAPTTVVAVVEGLLTAFAPYLTSFTTDAPWCCAQPMCELPQSLLGPSLVAAGVQRVFHCPVCSEHAFIDPTDGQVYGLAEVVN